VAKKKALAHPASSLRTKKSFLASQEIVADDLADKETLLMFRGNGGKPKLLSNFFL